MDELLRYLSLDEDEDEEEQIEIPKIKVGDIEYSQDELSRYVGLGKIAEEVETKYNTKIDRVYPEYTRAQQELKELRPIKQQWEQERLKPAVPEDEAIRQAKDAARKVGLVTDEDFAELMAKSFRQQYLQERQAEKLLEEATSLETKYDGTDGRPKFSAEEILNYMRDTGIRSPEKAYKDKYESEIDAWKEQQLSKSRRPGLTTLSSTTAGGKQPSPVRPNKDNLQDLIRESLRLSE